MSKKAPRRNKTFQQISKIYFIKNTQAIHNSEGRKTQIYTEHCRYCRKIALHANLKTITNEYQNEKNVFVSLKNENMYNITAQ